MGALERIVDRSGRGRRAEHPRAEDEAEDGRTRDGRPLLAINSVRGAGVEAVMGYVLWLREDVPAAERHMPEEARELLERSVFLDGSRGERLTSPFAIVASRWTYSSNFRYVIVECATAPRRHFNPTGRRACSRAPPRPQRPSGATSRPSSSGHSNDPNRARRYAASPRSYRAPRKSTDTSSRPWSRRQPSVARAIDGKTLPARKRKLAQKTRPSVPTVDP
jgi:hypothetical protein